MAIDIVSVGRGLGGYLKPNDHLNAWAILVEPKRSAVIDGQYGEKLTITGDITIFPNADAVATGQVVEMADVSWDQTYLARDAEPHIGKAFIANIALTKSGKGTSWRNISDPAIVKAVVAYAESRDADLSKAVEGAPDF